MGKAILNFISCFSSIAFQALYPGFVISIPFIIGFLLSFCSKPFPLSPNDNYLWILAGISYVTMFCWSGFWWSIRVKGIGCPPWQMFVLELFALPQLMSILIQPFAFRGSLLAACLLAIVETIFLLFAFWISAMAIHNDWL